MVNTVGGYAGGVKLWDLETKDFDQMLALNLRAGYALSRAAISPMLKQKAGAIVNVAAKAAFDHAAGASAYAASKAAALAMIDCLAADAERHGRAGEFDSAQHYRHGGEQEGHAGREFCDVAEA